MNETLYFSMAEASRRSGVSTATLRKWAARYSIDASHRSPGGHRLYTEADVERLCRVQELKARGWALNDLAELSLESLAKMSPLEDHDDIPGQICFSGNRVVAEFSPWFKGRAKCLDESEVSMAVGCLVWEVGSLSDQHVARVQRLINSGVPVLVVYHYALSRRLKQLEAIGAATAAGPLNWSTLMEWLLGLSPDLEFTDESLKRWVASNPASACECPRHLAELLLKLRDFARYCQQCSIDSPAQADVHQRLFHWTQAAQRPLEKGLAAVIAHEELDATGVTNDAVTDENKAAS